jgi:hypothetical protein
VTYTARLGGYLRQRPNRCSAPELTHLTGAQRRRLTHKLNHRKAAVTRRKASAS